MAKRKTDDQLRKEISLHSDTMRELSEKSHDTHKLALDAESIKEHTQIMKTVINLQRLSIKESKVVIHLEKILRNRQRKMMMNQHDLYKSLPN